MRTSTCCGRIFSNTWVAPCVLCVRGWPASNPSHLPEENLMRVALVTGAGSGIGLAISKKFLQTGVAVVGIGRDPAKLATLQALATELGQLHVAVVGPRARAVQAHGLVQHLACFVEKHRFYCCDFVVFCEEVQCLMPE